MDYTLITVDADAEMAEIDDKIYTYSIFTYQDVEGAGEDD